MTIPPYAAALGVALFVGYASDYFAVRGVSIGLCNILTIIGLGIYFGSQVHLVRYGCLIIVISGSLSVVGLITAWVANNAFPYIRRASALAISGMAFGMGLIMMVWLAGNIGRDTMTVVLLALAAAEGMISIVNTVWLRWKNEMMNCMREDDRYGDDSKWFMYTL
ncbi:hypothetical protein E1B28_010694 [Marasmius oreades]|uniref:Uncharacterized protein n=1 Tax=Marasmius oreades TaxID=181124 RepID=A0A9P7RXK9_9AGAR|nr:uncharacterized protein E1B28_010694 [Marasmius oreades]KAG7091674.1 hypothetical protein E1B28_010694 [Marasmius oreades]